MITPHTFDPDCGALLRDAGPRPVDPVARFLHLHAPRHVPPSSVRVLEIGCAARGNVCHAARAGFDAAAAETSAGALEGVRDGLRAEGLSCELHLVELARLPFADASFDLVVEHGALSVLGRTDARRALRELARVLGPSGRLYFNPYSDRHTGARTGRHGSDGLTLGVQAGVLHGAPVCFWSPEQVTAALVDDWRVLSRQHVEYEELDCAPRTIHAEWRLVAEKVA